MKIRFAALAVLFATATAPAGAGPSPSYLYYTGNGYTAAGQTRVLSSLNGFRFEVGTLFQGTYFSISSTPYDPSDPKHSDLLSILVAAPYFDRFAVGRYMNATRAPFQAPGVPGFDFYGNGRGSSVIDATFEVLDVAYDDVGVITAFAMDFTQIEERGYAGTTYGSFRYQSDIPITLRVAEPESLLLIVPLLVMLLASAGTCRSSGRPRTESGWTRREPSHPS